MKYRITIPGVCSFVPKENFINRWAAFNYVNAILGKNIKGDVKLRKVLK